MARDSAHRARVFTIYPTLCVDRVKESFQGWGEPVTIDGIAARREDLHLGFVFRITFADGRHIQLSAAQ